MRASAIPLTLLTAALFVAGCSSTGGTGARWYAPATWFSHKPGDNVDAAQKREAKATSDAIKQAQKATHGAQVALAVAPPSRAVEVATDYTSEAVQLLDQAAGPLTASEVAKLKATVAGLMSENAELRSKAEKDRASERKQVIEISEKLSKAEAETASAREKLRQAYDRENALANELRSQRALFWIACGVGVLGFAGWIYLRIVLGGVPQAIGLAMRDIKTKHPDIAKQIAPYYTKYLNRHEQAAIARHAP